MHSKSDIKKWLKETGKDCNWLAEQCRVSIRTVYGWMSVRRKIPAKSLARIRELMAWIASHLQPGEVIDIDEWIKDYCHNIHRELS